MPRTSADDAMIDRVLEREGGFVDNPFDKGGPTNKGITMKTLGEFLGRPATLDDVRNITVDMARDIYYQMYIVLPGFDTVMNLELREFLFDAGVNHGPGNAIKQLQRGYNSTNLQPQLKVDGVLGRKSLDAINLMNPNSLLLRVAGQRLRFYGNIVAKNPQQREFCAGWFNRMADLLDSIA